MKKCTIDPDHSVATFAIKHLTLANVRGMFSKVSGCVYYDPNDVARSSVEAEIDVRSLSTGIRKRDEHILSGEMLDAARFPTMTFKSTRVVPEGTGKAQVHGDLTIHGVTRPVVFSAEYVGPVKSPWGGEVSLGFAASTTIDREDFGILWGSDVLEGGGLLAGKDVVISIDMEADLPKE